MLRSVYIAGIVFLIVGFLLVGVGLLPSGTSATRTIPAGSQSSVAATTLTPQTLSVSWTNETVMTHVYIITGTPACSSPSGLVARATGANGTVAATLRPGTTYEIYACGATTFKTVTVNYTIKGGIGYEVILGGVSICFGTLLVLLGARRWRHEGVLDESGSAPVPWRVDPVSSAAALKESVRGSRTLPVRPATPANRLRGLSVVTCPSCGKAYSLRKYRACPHCASPYAPSSRTSR